MSRSKERQPTPPADAPATGGATDPGLDVVGRPRPWYAVSAALLVVAILGLLIRGLTPGIDLAGGTEFTVGLPAERVTQQTVEEVREHVRDLGIPAAGQPVVTTVGTEELLVQTRALDPDETTRVVAGLERATGADPDDIASGNLGPRWGDDVRDRGLLGLGVFLLLALLFVRAHLGDWKAVVASLVAVVHVAVITLGVYALVGLDVSPATVTGMLAVIAFSLYDTVLVLDRVRESTAMMRSRRTTYARAADLALAQTLPRSIHVAIVVLLPMVAILGVGAVTGGAGPLTGLALVLFVGLLSALYSSVFLAVPLLARLKAGEKEIVIAGRRATARARRGTAPARSRPKRGKR